MTTSKKNVRQLGKVFDYLNDPELRKKEIGDALLMVKDAEISGANFEQLDWHNIVFSNCDFVGAYQLKLKTSNNVRYEDCRFSGIFGYGRSQKLHFVRCAWTDGSVAYAGEQSVDVVFDSCQFVGTNTEPNHWGGVGSDGEAEFIGCTAKLFNLDGHAKLTIRRCEFENIDCIPRSSESGGVFSQVLIENSRLLGSFDMRPATLLSLTIRDTTIGTLDLSNATVKGDILMERVTGGCIKAGIKEGANSFTLRDSQIMGNGERVCNVYAGAFQQVLIENVTFGSVEGQPVGIGGGYEPEDKNPQPIMTQSVKFKNVKARSLRSARLNAGHLRLENVEVGDANFREGHIGALEFENARFSGQLDLTGTQVKDFKQSGTTDLKKLGLGLKLDGSNIKLPK